MSSLCIIFQCICYTFVFAKGHNFGSCRVDQLQCANDRCIDRSYRCDGTDNCYDNSDEVYCIPQKISYYDSSEECHSGYHKCYGYELCIPIQWICDGHIDCYDESDEIDCEEKMPELVSALHDAALWIENKGKKISAMDEGYILPRIVVSLYLANESYFSSHSCVADSIAKEFTIHLLGTLWGRKIEANELALFLHGLLALCIDARNFFGKDLVSMLREKVNNQPNHTNPFVLLALCNAGEKMTEQDFLKLSSVVKESHVPSWTDVQALALMALTCINDQQSDLKVNAQYLTSLSTYMKKRQTTHDGSIETLYTTGLVLQALSGFGQMDYTPFWINSVRYLLRNQLEDGSFKNLMNTYAVLPVLNRKSFRNLDLSHCNYLSTENSSTHTMRNAKLDDEKVQLEFTLRFDNRTDLELTLKFKMDVNKTLLDAIIVAATIDHNYKCEYAEHSDGYIYVYSLSGFRNDPENEIYWFLYKVNGTDVSDGNEPIKESLNKIIPKDDEKYLMWYRHDHWNK